jgi:general secretion pathway protein A
MIVHDLGIPPTSNNKFSLLRSLNEFLIAESMQGNNIVVVIDESQHLSTEQLEQVRLLSNLETEKEKLLQIVLVGQPELHQKLQLPELRQLRQRVAVHYHVQPLSRDDVRLYVDHRLSKAVNEITGPTQIQFTDEAIDTIFHYSKGSPRIINIICDRALLAGFVAETYSIDDDIIQNCSKEILYCEHH